MDETQNSTSAPETTIDISDNINGHEEETKDDIWKISKNHRETIGRIFVSQYMDDTEYGLDDYAVTYSKKDKSVLGWSIKENGPQADVYFKIDQIDGDLSHFNVLLSKKFLSFYNYENDYLVDLNSGRTSSERFLKLKHHHIISRNWEPHKPKNTDPWEYSQIYDIVIPESLYRQTTICRTKLFLIVEGCKILMLQFDLLTMNLERQYTLELLKFPITIVINKNQTILAIDFSVFYRPIGFITLKDNSERLVIVDGFNNWKLVDPYQVYDEIDISNDKSVIAKLNRNIVIEDGNVYVKNEIDENNENGLDENNENKLQQLSNKTIYRNSIYTFPTFKVIRSMLNEVIDQVEIKRVISSEETVLKKNKNLDKFILRGELSHDTLSFEQDNFSRIIPHILLFKLLNNQDLVLIHVKGIEIYTINEYTYSKRYFWNNNEWKDIYERFKKDCNVIYDINFINKYYKPLIERILKNEFDDSNHSIPLPKSPNYDVEEIVEDVINNNFVSSEFGTETLKIAIKENWDFSRIVINNLLPKVGIELLKRSIKKGYDNIIRQIINKAIEDDSENNMLIISLTLLELCDNYPDFIIKYISCTSIKLSPFCNRIGNSKNTSLCSYTNFYIKESSMDNNGFKSISATYKWLTRDLRIKKEIQVVSFIVPFPQICVYQDDSENNDHDENHETENNSDIKSKMITILKKIITGLKIIMIIPKSNSIWNEFLYTPKSILFCNIDSNNFYDWWNFAAIIDYKWKTFGIYYYFLIWLFYTIFYICYSLASTLEQKSIPDFYFELLFIISIIFGSTFLIFEIRQCLWNYECYFNDIWNLFDQIASMMLNVATKYDFVNPDGTISNATTMIQDPDSNKNLFNWFPTSLLAVYKLLTGDSGSLSSFTFREHSIMTILLVTFTFFTVIYLMNLFIGLLNLAIDDYNKKEEFLLQKAQIIMEIELFYMSSRQRNNKIWFPDWIYFEIPVTEVRKLINAIDNEQTVFNYPPVISKKLRELVVLTDVKKQTKEELAQEVKEKMNELESKLEKQNMEFKRQMECIMKYIGVEQGNKEEKDNKEENNKEKNDNEKEQDNKLGKQIEQTKEKLPKQNVGLKQQMDKLSQQMENIMELLKEART
ncbi:hypothetical protein RclHR1_05800012 [Rhizophagus clarus]|uniref:Ion transport domain-containing protein n=1 Tax=Rhizophagus clarus TaxID=94130 RepID=A0A2Z6S1K9_9GLOM|nr:hypothetical protein RclHR1_05800012 [Rhizophagus clarus]